MKSYFKARIYFNNSVKTDVLTFQNQLDVSKPTYAFNIPNNITIESVISNIDYYTPETYVTQEYANGDMIVLTKCVKTINQLDLHKYELNYSKLIGVFKTKKSIEILEEDYNKQYVEMVHS